MSSLSFWLFLLNPEKFENVKTRKWNQFCSVFISKYLQDNSWLLSQKGHSFCLVIPCLARKNTREVTCLISYCSHVLKIHLLLSCTHTHSKDDSQNRLTMNFFLGFRKDAKIRGSSPNKPQVFYLVLKVAARWHANTMQRKECRPGGPLLVSVNGLIFHLQARKCHGNFCFPLQAKEGREGWGRRQAPFHCVLCVAPKLHLDIISHPLWKPSIFWF